MEKHNPNHSSIVLPEIFFSSDDKKDRGGSGNHPCTGEPHPGTVSSTMTKTTLVQSPIKSQESNGSSKVVFEDGSTPSGEQKLQTGPPHLPNTVFEKSSELDLKQASRVLAKPPAGKTVFSKTVSVKTVPVTLPKTEQTFSVVTSQIPVRKFQNVVTFTRDKGISSNRVGTGSAVVERPVFENDDALFPVKGGLNVTVKDSDVLVKQGSQVVNEVKNHCSSGMSLLQTSYSDDSLEDESDVQDNSKSSEGQVVQTTASSDINGLHAQVSHDSQMLTKVKNLGSKTVLVNRFVESEQAVTVVPSHQLARTAHPAGERLKSMHGQASSRISSAPKVPTSIPQADISIQSLHNPNSSCSVAGYARSQTPTVNSTHNRKVIGSTKVPYSSDANNVSSNGSNTSLGKSQESSTTGQQTAIIDPDNKEILLIINPQNTPVDNSGSGKKTYSSTAREDQQNIFLDEDQEVSFPITAPAISKTMSSSPPLARPMTSVSSASRRPCSPSVRKGTVTDSSTTTSTPNVAQSPPLGSSSPSQPGCATPAVFRFSERGVSSGRTIAPPKRYLDDDDEVRLSAFPKKRNRDKTTPGKPRSAIR